ncbi:MAG TPA: hypothetical protein VF147_12490 [Vicinamibacterales bacterium]
MTKNWMLTTTMCAICVTAGTGAQSMKDMAKPSDGHVKSATYTGCVESVNNEFLLTNAVSAKPMHGDMAMKHDDGMAMKHDDGMAMKHEGASMKSDTAAPMQHEQTPMADENKDAAPTKFVLAGSPKLEKHVGQKISVTGSRSEGATGSMQPPTLTIQALKVIAKSCS